MGIPADREGFFRAHIEEYGCRDQESGAVCLSVKAKLLQIWSEEEKAWSDWGQYDMEAYGDLWLVKRDGTLNKLQVQALAQHCGWDGNFLGLTNGEWEPKDCQVAIKRDEYENVVRFRIAFVNDYHRIPGALGNIDEARARSLQTRYGSELRAIVGNAKRNAVTVPSGAPPIPPPPAQRIKGGEDIPF